MARVVSTHGWVMAFHLLCQDGGLRVQFERHIRRPPFGQPIAIPRPDLLNLRPGQKHLFFLENSFMSESLTDETKANMRFSYALRWVPRANMATLLPCPVSPQAGDMALAKLEKIGKNATLELANGRRCTLHEGDLLAVVFGNRYATLQFEGYARANGDSCDLLSMAVSAA